MDAPDNQKEFDSLQKDFIDKVTALSDQYKQKVQTIFAEHETRKQDEVRKKLGI